MNPATAGIAVVAVALGGWGLLAASPQQEPAGRDEVCRGLEDLRASFDVSTWGGQAAIRRAGAALAETAGRYPEVAQAGAHPVRSASESIRHVLRLRYTTSRDLWSAARPVAVLCSRDWRSWGPNATDLLDAP